MKIKYTTEINKQDWQYILDNASSANIFHSAEYFDIQQADGHQPVYACCYDGEKPVAVIAGVINKIGYHQGLTEIGTKSGGFPLMTDEYDHREDSEKIKNDFIRYFTETCLKDNKFFFYPCFNMKSCILENPEFNCKKQYDQTVMLDLKSGTDNLWKGLNHKCRNVIRYAEKEHVTARIANENRYFELFYRFYQDVREKRNTKYMSFKELKSRFDYLTANNLADLWVSFLEDKPLAYAFIWKYKKIINFVYGSSDPETLPLKPNNLVQWELIKYYQQNGYLLYNMWGIRNMNFSEKDSGDKKIEGYGKFKLSFGSELKDIVRYFRIE